MDHASDPRIKDRWSEISLTELPAWASKGSHVIVSYPDDEGVQLNRGRVGAQDGPDRILHYFGRFVWPESKNVQIFVLKDRLRDPSLGERHERAEAQLKNIFERNFKVITLGGGHDYGYPDAAAYYQAFKGKILNIDAHLDVRPVLRSEFNSGTAFSRFSERFSGRPLIAYGIQKQCNASVHLAYAKKKGIKVVPLGKPLPKITGKIGLSICLDAFQGIRGVSAPAVVGLDPREGMRIVENLSSKSMWMGLYECAPRYDPEHEDSARLGALAIHRFIFGGTM